MNLLSFYTEKKASYKLSKEELQTKYERFGFIRLVVFIIGVALAILAFSYHPAVGIAWLFIFLFIFNKFIKYHKGLKEQKEFVSALYEVNAQELDFLNNRFEAFDDGAAFLDVNHPYALDMDIFGKHSIFQFFNRATSQQGRKRLAAYLSHPASHEEIQRRQEAIKELKDKVEWRQEFRAGGLLAEDSEEHLQQLRTWLEQPDIVKNNPLIRAALWGTPLLAIAGITLWLYGIPWYIALLSFLPALYLIRTTLEHVNEVQQLTSQMGEALSHYAQQIKKIEAENFNAKKLLDLQAAFLNGKDKASDRTQYLSYLIHQLEVRNNPFILIFNLFFLWDLHWVYRLEKWKDLQREDMLLWIDAMAHFEALSSFATVWYNRPSWSLPTITDEKIYEGKDLKHPLLPVDIAIGNDFSSPTAGHLKLLTGSNMAGKSTFLRTIGVNLVLAMAGSAVSAASLRLPILQLYTSMRTQDALEENTSSFYAELKRLKIIIEAVEQQDNIFFLLDEILKGTNSNDRHTGARALIKQLIKTQGAGIIATHDLELGNMALENGKEGKKNIENICMEVEVEDEQLTFDYKLKPGVSKSFNATVLMRNMGIKI